MSIATHSATFRAPATRPDFAGALLAGWRSFLLHRRQRRALARIARLPPHLIRDLGHDPEQIYYALKGTWDEVDAAGFRMLLPKA